jgi:threonine dehydrogenase-like Zn-dependent dehydrogenase
MNAKNKVLAATLVGPEQLDTLEYEYTPPAQDAVTLKVEMAGICGTDKHTFQGYVQQYGDRPLQYPIIPGHETVGRILEIGPRDKPLCDYYGERLYPDDRVVVAANLKCGRCYYCIHGFPYYYCLHTLDYGNLLNAAKPPYLFGGWSQIMYLLPGTFLFKVHDDIPNELAVLTEPMAVTASLDRAKQFSALSTEGFRFGDTVVVQGVGPIGVLHIAKARMLGAGRIIAVDSAEYRLKFASRLGADETLNVSTTTTEDRLERIRELTKGLGADVVVECAGVAEAIPEGLDMLRIGGVYLEVGNFADLGECTINPHRQLLARNVRLIGISGDELTSYGPSMNALYEWSQWLPLMEIVSDQFPLQQAKKAMSLALSNEAMKVVLTPASA